MTLESTQVTWNEIKGKIKSKWMKLSEDEIETVRENLKQIERET